MKLSRIILFTLSGLVLLGALFLVASSPLPDDSVVQPHHH